MYYIQIKLEWALVPNMILLPNFILFHFDVTNTHKKDISFDPQPYAGNLPFFGSYVGFLPLVYARVFVCVCAQFPF